MGIAVSEIEFVDENEKAKARRINCTQIAGAVTWKNKKISIEVCAASPQAAAGKVTAAKIKEAVEKKAEAAIGLDCSDGEGCGDTQTCQPDDVIVTAIRVTQRPAALRCTRVARVCPAGEQGYSCSIRADIKAKQQCACKA